MVDGKWNKFRDDVTHDGKRIDWGQWAIVGTDTAFGGTGNPDTGTPTTAPPMQHESATDIQLIVLVCLTHAADGVGS